MDLIRWQANMFAFSIHVLKRGLSILPGTKVELEFWV